MTAISALLLNGTPQIDLRQDTTGADKTLYGETGHGNDGEEFTGEIPERDADDLTVSGATVTVPAGHYAEQASKQVAAGTAGTPVATKGSANNGAIQVTPSVTNQAGYIASETKNGTPVTVTAAELVSGTKQITQNGTNIDVTEFATVDVAVAASGPNIATATMTNSNNQAQSIDFTLTAGRTVKACFVRLTSQVARSSSYRYYYVFDLRWDGSTTGGVAGNTFYMYSGTLTNVTSGYSHSQDGTTFTLSTTGTRSTSPGSFYNGTYELVYAY